MDQAIMIGIDLIAISVMTFGLYFPRHRRKDLVVAFLVVNIGVLAVSAVLGSSTIGAGLGLGLFGVLSIIRLRSSEIAQHEVAYYFAALALGLMAGLTATISPLIIVLMALVLVVLVVGDHPALFRRYRQQLIELDTAYADEVALKAALERMLGARVYIAKVVHLDLVNDTTTVDVRYQLTEPARSAPVAAATPAESLELSR